MFKFYTNCCIIFYNDKDKKRVKNEKLQLCSLCYDARIKCPL